MATLFICFDLDAKTIRGASIEGKTLDGLTSVNLSNGSVSLRHFDGHDMLGGTSPEIDSLPPLNSKAQADIADAFGVGAQ